MYMLWAAVGWHFHLTMLYVLEQCGHGGTIRQKNNAIRKCRYINGGPMS